jgi:hypothetical protein
MSGRGLSTAAPGAMAAVALLVGAIAAVLAVEAASIAGPHPITWIPDASAYDAAAAQALARDPARARDLALKSLKLRPVDGRAWLTWAMADSASGRGLSPPALSALERSYDVAPYDPQLAADRVALVYSHWTELPAGLRQEVQSEVRVAWTNPAMRPQLFAASTRTTTFRGRMALAAELFRLNMLDEIAQSRARPRS